MVDIWSVFLVVWSLLSALRLASMISSMIWLYQYGEDFARGRRRLKKGDTTHIWRLLQGTHGGISPLRPFGVKSYFLFWRIDVSKSRLARTVLRVVRGVWLFQTWASLSILLLGLSAFLSADVTGVGAVAGVALGFTLAASCAVAALESVFSTYLGGWAAYHGLTYDRQRKGTKEHLTVRALMQLGLTVALSILSVAAFLLFAIHQTDWIATSEPTDPTSEVLDAIRSSVTQVYGFALEPTPSLGARWMGIASMLLAFTNLVAFVMVTLVEPRKLRRKK